MTHLRLVKPAPPKGPPRRPPPLFRPDEEQRIRAALKNARPLFGSWACLADALHLDPKHVQAVASGKKGVAGAIVVRLARALGVPLESLYRAPSDADVCPHCGRRS